jgi:hypothetical protein
MMRYWHRLAAIGVLLGILAIPLHASAQWNSPGSGAAYSKARQMPVGNAPTTNVTGRNVTVSWSVNSFPDGTPVNEYVVRRYDASTGTLQTIGAGCSGLIAALNCTENAVPPGTWRYTVQPRHGNWQGTESATSSSTTVGSPTLSFGSPPPITTLPTTLAGTLTNFVTGSTVTYRLDNPVSGTLLSGTTTPSPIPNNGNATVSVTIPKATTNGAHVVYAIGNQGDVASAAINVNVTPPTPTDLMLRNVLTAGRPRQTDRIEVTFSQRMDVASICSTWSGDSTNQLITGNNVAWVVITNNAAPSGNDQLTVATTATACGGQFHFGNVDLGSPNFVTGDTYYGGSATNQTIVAWNATTFRLDITLGAIAFGPAPGTVGASVTATYTPDPVISNPSGTPITGTASRTAVQF